jgi:FkbM family methyltransferase
MLKNILCHTIFIDPLNKNLAPIVIDCGANKGEFSDYAHVQFTARCYGFEPDPRLFKNLVNKKNITYLQKALGSSEGMVRLNLGEKHCSSLMYKETSNQNYVEVEMTTLENFCTGNNIESINLLKIDIEGAELDLLENIGSEFLSKIEQITVEFHDFLDKNDIPRIKNIIKRMRKENFYVLKLSYFTYGDILMINQRKIPISFLQKLIFVIYKYIVGSKRLASKVLKVLKL